MDNETKTTLIICITIALIAMTLIFTIAHHQTIETKYEKCIDKCSWALDENTLELQCIENCNIVLNCENEKEN